MVRRIIASLVVAVLILLCTEGVSSAKPGLILDLGTLGGASSSGYGINARGQVVGMATTSTGEAHAFLWSGGRMQDLGTLGGGFSVATAINDVGQVVGNSRTAGGELHAFLWQDGQMSDLGTLGGVGFSGVPTSTAQAINNLGQVVGQTTTEQGNPGYRAYLWSDGQMSDLGTLPGDDYSDASGINDRGEVVGTSATLSGHHVVHPHAFVRVDGVLRGDLIGALGGDATAADDINNQRQVVGTSATATGSGDAFRWELGKMRDLGPGEARSVSEQGQAVGSSGQHAALWKSRALRDLGALDASSTSAATSVANVGESIQIAGTSTTAMGVSHAVLWTIAN
jgi:probable HAF family extracellular repeat protein